MTVARYATLKSLCRNSTRKTNTGRRYRIIDDDASGASAHAVYRTAAPNDMKVDLALMVLLLPTGLYDFTATFPGGRRTGPHKDYVAPINRSLNFKEPPR